MSSNSLKSTI